MKASLIDPPPEEAARDRSSIGTSSTAKRLRMDLAVITGDSVVAIGRTKRATDMRLAATARAVPYGLPATHRARSGARAMICLDSAAADSRYHDGTAPFVGSR